MGVKGDHLGLWLLFYWMCKLGMGLFESEIFLIKREIWGEKKFASKNQVFIENIPKMKFWKTSQSCLAPAW